MFTQNQENPHKHQLEEKIFLPFHFLQTTPAVDMTTTYYYSLITFFLLPIVPLLNLPAYDENLGLKNVSGPL